MEIIVNGRIGDSDFDRQAGTILDSSNDSNEGKPSNGPSDDGIASILDLVENDLPLEGPQDNHEAYSNTLEQLCYKQKLNGFLRTALARGARLLSRSDPERADLFRKGINVLQHNSKSQGLRILAAIFALNFVFGALIPLVASGGSVDIGASGQPPTLLTLPGDSGKDFQLGDQRIERNTTRPGWGPVGRYC